MHTCALFRGDGGCSDGLNVYECWCSRFHALQRDTKPDCSLDWCQADYLHGCLRRQVSGSWWETLCLVELRHTRPCLTFWCLRSVWCLSLAWAWAFPGLESHRNLNPEKALESRRYLNPEKVLGSHRDLNPEKVKALKVVESHRLSLVLSVKGCRWG